ncbi:MAG: hypothetical protein LBN96_06070 [Desulfovibrio sp.]|nr:hypothetical protein [Desulfovibrio sp.]
MLNFLDRIRNALAVSADGEERDFVRNQSVRTVLAIVVVVVSGFVMYWIMS